MSNHDAITGGVRLSAAVLNALAHPDPDGEPLDIRAAVALVRTAETAELAAAALYLAHQLLHALHSNQIDPAEYCAGVVRFADDNEKGWQS